MIFGDLNLDQVVAAVAAGRDEYDLRPFFHEPLRDVDAVEYRHRVVQDLERDDVRSVVDEFAALMQRVRRHLRAVQERSSGYERQRYFLDAADLYCQAVTALWSALARVELASEGLAGLREHLAGYLGSGAIQALARDAGDMLDELAAVRYCVHVRGAKVTVSRYEGQADYTPEIVKTFARFRQGEVADYRVRLRYYQDINHVEEWILERVARLFPETFTALADFCRLHVGFVDETVTTFDREVQFYLAYLTYMRRFTDAGLSFCCPEVSATSKRLRVSGAFDLALATKLAGSGSEVVCNDIDLSDAERVVVVTGPNQGGKTTFARMFGQLHYLAALGLPVPARSARLFLPDRVFTHFEREESLDTLHGKLEDELVRIHDVLDHATGDSVIVMNETFTSTTLQDALVLGTQILSRIVDRDCLAVYVTFVDELSLLSEATVSMVGMVVPDDPARRTFEVVRRAADGRAYAMALAEKYGLTYEALRRRVG
ncbi:MutS-related protein [Jiangella anatolica]|uniref:MutS-related protein n=1 Tax=Jiangella anatolica TaxID=2670374 RepID=UPI0018F4CBA9|nr:hypothetical protein [Jiangella anatolica]